MKIGDVVNFFAGAWIFELANRRYQNPGVILDVDDQYQGGTRYVVLWADGKITKEHSGYLEKECDIAESR